MFKPQKKEPHPLDSTIADIISELDNYAPHTDEYHKTLDRLERAEKLKNNNVRTPISSDTAAIVAGNIVVTTIVVFHERTAIILSKFGQFLLKAKN